MGVSLDYVSRTAVAADVSTAVHTDAERLSGARNWTTSEPIHFFDHPDFQGKLWGCSKYGFFDPISTDEEEAAQSSTGDLEFIVEQLCRWSREYGVTWEVSSMGEHLCSISAGQCDPSIESFLAFFDHIEDFAMLGDGDDEDAE